MLCDGFTYFSQSVGVTATLPHSVPYVLPTTGAGSDEWYLCGKRLWHNQSSTEFHNIPYLNDLSIHQKIGLQISTNGELYMFIDDQHMQCIATGVPVNKPLWGAVDVLGHYTKIKSEMLSGELVIHTMYMYVNIYICRCVFCDI